MSVWKNLSNAFQLGSAPLTQHATEDVINKSQRAQESKAVIEDPLSIVQSLGFKDKPFSLSYDTLRRMSVRNSVIASIITTRVNQVSTFSQPARYTMDGIGYQITLRDPKKQPTSDQKRMIMAMEAFLENCGYTYDPGRDGFDTFLRKILRDSLTFDQLTFEVVPDRLGRPAEMYAVDASTIRAASPEADVDTQYITSTSINANQQRWVQVIDGSVITDFSSTELAFAVRNPRTDINVQPYGFAELEVLIQQITAHLWAEEYNSRYFSQGGTTKGVLNLKGTNISKEQIEAFRRQWTAQLSGITGAWKTPVVSVDGLEYINVSQSNREMEYEMWMNYLINICSAVFQIDPAEINFPNRGGSGGSGGGGLGDGGIEDRLKNSRDKGLRPLLRFLESVINRYIIRRFSSDYSFNFVGLDKESEADKLTIIEKSVRSYRTINEIRKEKDLDPIKDGDIILDPTYVNYIMQLQQQEQMEQQQQQPTGEDGNPLDPEEAQQANQDQQITDSMDDQYQ